MAAKKKSVRKLTRPETPAFDSSMLDRSVVAIPLLERMFPDIVGKERHDDGQPEGLRAVYDVIIDANYTYLLAAA